MPVPVVARLLRLWVRIPPGAWMSVCCECCVLSGRGLCNELITRPEESYRLWYVAVCDLENLKNEEAMARVGPQRYKKNTYYTEWSKSHLTTEIPCHINFAPLCISYNWINRISTESVNRDLLVWDWVLDGAVGWGTAPQAGRSRFRLPMVSLEFFIDINLPAALCSWGWLSL